MTSTSLSIPSRIDAEKEPFACQQCGDSMPYSRISHGPFGFVYSRKRCSCESERHAKKEAEEAAKKQAQEERRQWERIQELKKRSRIVGKLARMSLDGYTPNKDTAKAFAAAKSLVKHWPTKTGLFFRGSNGTGKTHLAVAIGNALLDKGARVECWTGFDLLDAFRASYDTDTEENLFERLKNIDLLIYDDLGNERIAHDEKGDWAREKVFSLLYWRDVLEKPMVITSNRSMEYLLEHLGSATVSRIVGMCGKPLEMNTSDHRVLGRPAPDSDASTAENDYCTVSGLKPQKSQRRA